MDWKKITVICFVIGVMECAAMAVSEIEEFRNFLKKTSHLEETLKKGPGVDHDDDGGAVSDHAWEDSGKFEGDIILNERQRKVIVQEVAEGLSRNGLLDTTKRWPDNEVIFYIQREHFTSDQVQAIEDGMSDLAQASCIKFRPYKKGDRDAVVIQGSRRGCFSQVGYQGGYQVLNLSGRHPVGRGCFRHGTVVHELLHTLGFYHMQSSPDRDDYINVLWENIIEPAKHNFRKYNTFSVSDFGVGYDYDSVLHYSRRAFSRNGRDTLVPKQGGASIGQRAGLSDKDTQKLNKMYCDAGTDDAPARDEQTTEKSASKKQKAPEPKHFEGHGLAYHKGKTVIIKLTPSEAKTYKIPDYSTFHMFDYFSNTPEALPPTFEEETGIRKQVDYSYEPPQTDFKSSSPGEEKDSHNLAEQHNELYDGSENDKSSSSKAKKNDELHDSSGEDKQTNNDEPFSTPDAENENKLTNHHTDEKPTEKDKDRKGHTGNKETDKTENHSDNEKSKESKDEKPPEVTSDDTEFDYNEAFDRLGKIIKAHVYPSQKPNFDIYKGIGYEFEDGKKFSPKNEKLEKTQHKNNLSFSVPKDSKHFYVLNDKIPREFAQLYDAAAKISQEAELLNNSNVKDKVANSSESSRSDPTARQDPDDAYEYPYPYRDEYDSIMDKFDSAEHLPYKDYSRFWYPTIKKKPSENIDEGADSAESFDDQRQHSHESDDEYPYDIYSAPDFKFSSSRSKHQRKPSNPEIDKPHRKNAPAFKIIGLLVPITDDIHKERSR